MDSEEIKSRLEARGYYISPNYGLILTDKGSELVIADIRKCEEKIVLPWWNKIETEEVTKLRGILLRESIPFRDKIRGN